MEACKTFGSPWAGWGEVCPTRQEHPAAHRVGVAVRSSACGSRERFLREAACRQAGEYSGPQSSVQLPASPLDFTILKYEERATWEIHAQISSEKFMLAQWHVQESHHGCCKLLCAEQRLLHTAINQLWVCDATAP